MIKLFKRPNCAFCPQVMKYYDHIGVAYEVHEAEGREYEKLSQQFGFSVPLIYNDETGKGFCGYNIPMLKELAGV